MTKTPMLKAITSSTQTLLAKTSSYLQFNTWLYPLCVVTAMLFVVACDQTPGDTGLGVLPEEDQIGLRYTDTLSIEFETQIRDRVLTGLTPWQLVGNYYDPAFGRIEATTYTEILIPGADLEFGEELEFVGLRLDLDLLGVYGSFNSPFALNIYELAESISDNDSTLISDHPALQTTGPELSGKYQIDFSDASSFSDIRIPLSSALGEKILFADSATLSTNESFTAFFKGLAISSDAATFTTREPGAIYNVFLNSSASSLTLTYRRKEDDGNGKVLDSLEFVINTTAQKFHTINRSATNNLVFEEFGINQATPGNEIYEFIQAGPLVRTFVRVPFLDSLPLIGVNRAELMLRVDRSFFGSGSRYTPPASVFFFLADENRNLFRDDNGRPTVIASATYNSDSAAYILNMTAQTQLIISNRRENNGFIILPDDSASSLNRAVFGGVDHPMLKPSFRLTYSELPK